MVVYFCFLHQFTLMYYNNKQRYHGSKTQWLLCLCHALLSCKRWMFAFLLSCGAVSATECIIYVVGEQVWDRKTHSPYCTWHRHTPHTTLHYTTLHYTTFSNNALNQRSANCGSPREDAAAGFCNRSALEENTRSSALLVRNTNRNNTTVTNN
jgi:hypothetical protein